MADRYDVFETEFGHCAIAWTKSGISRFQLPARSAAATAQNMLRRIPTAEIGTPTMEVRDAVVAVQRYFKGDAVDFSELTLDLAGQPDFFCQIYDALRRVEWGQTTTYGTLAKQVDAGAQGARDVGQAMAKNPVPLIIPCHRVLAAGGKAGGFSAPGGATAKINMLKLEGIRLAPSKQAQQTLGF